MSISKEDITKADKNLQEIFDNLGPNDIYKILFLEVLLEEIYGKHIDLSNLIQDDTTQLSSPTHSALTNPKD